MSRGLFVAQCRREWLAAVRSPQDALNPLVFLFLAATLFALAGGGDRAQLAAFAPGVIWVLVLLANMLSLEGLFRRDYDNGTLEQQVLLARPGFLAVLAKVLVQWALTGLSMTLLAPVLALILYLPVAGLATLVTTLLLGTPALSLLGAVGAALTVGLKRGGVLLGLLILPMYIPILIFGAGAVSEALAGIDTTAQIYWLAAITMLSLTLAPFGVQAALRISLEQ